ncbi:MAG: alkaline phosphatase [Bacteroides sp.]|nr:alkaline phosphatase [Bacteroides sp.]
MFFLLVVCLSVVAGAQGTPKYIFYLIGDGMGMSQVNGTEMYLASLEGRIGVKPLRFTQFPIAGMASTYSGSSGVTDSAAAGTALATGTKTKNGAIGVDMDLNPVMSVAERAKRAGKKVGIITSVSLDDATPAVFYAHQASRSMGYEIGMDAIASGFDFFGGSGFVTPCTRHDGSSAPDLFLQMEEAGYLLAYGYEEYKQKAAHAEKVILMNNRGADVHNLTCALDRGGEELNLVQITRSAIEVLSRDNTDGFFLMVEGGMIDWACHANDAATTLVEVLDFDAAVEVAYEFYLRHPEETLIVVTADHETGGMVLGTGSSRLNLAVLQNQKISQHALSLRISELRRLKGLVSWEEIQTLLSETMGLWKEVPVSERQEKKIYEAYENSFIKGDTSKEKSLYQEDEKLAAAARKVLNEIAMVGWTSSNHSAGYVPVFAIGVGAERFTGKMDNTDIPRRIAELAGYMEKERGYEPYTPLGCIDFR